MIIGGTFPYFHSFQVAAKYENVIVRVIFQYMAEMFGWKSVALLTHKINKKSKYYSWNIGVNASGKLPLNIAVQQNNVNMTKTLLAWKANPNLTDRAGNYLSIYLKISIIYLSISETSVYQIIPSRLIALFPDISPSLYIYLSISLFLYPSIYPFISLYLSICFTLFL